MKKYNRYSEKKPYKNAMTLKSGSNDIRPRSTQKQYQNLKYGKQHDEQYRKEACPAHQRQQHQRSPPVCTPVQQLPPADRLCKGDFCQSGNTFHPEPCRQCRFTVMLRERKQLFRDGENVAYARCNENRAVPYCAQKQQYARLKTLCAYSRQRLLHP